VVYWAVTGRRVGLGVVILAGVLAAGLWLRECGRPLPPRYQGKPLDYWLSLLATNVALFSDGEFEPWLVSLKSRPDASKNPALRALQTLGPQAVPFLALRVRNDFYGKLYTTAAPYLPQWLARRLPPPKSTLFSRQLALLLLLISDAPITQAVPDLVSVLTDKDLLVRRTACRLLGQIGLPARQGLPRLVALVADSASGAGDCAAVALAQIEAKAAAAQQPLPELKLRWLPLVQAVAEPRQIMVQPSGNDDQQIRTSLSGSFWKLGYDDYVVLPRLIQALTQRNETLRLGAVRVLGGIGLPAQSALAAVETTLGDADYRVRQACVETIPKLGANAAIIGRALGKALADNHAAVRKTALEVAKGCGPRAQDTAPALVGLLRDADREIRGRACQALGAIVGEAELIVPALANALDDPDSWVRQRAAEALGLYGGQAKSALPRLLERQKSATGGERYYLDKALKQIDPRFE
jgi:HEAT repeat protein